ncbi:PAS domain-containing protein [Klebsiella variicola subsp. variicola]|nr:PAS domain-containing protein [Klebsiella variicola subsp. variicola]
MSGRAKIQAEEIALMPNLRQQVSQHDPQAIRAFMQQIAAHSDASFIVIGDRQGRASVSLRPSGVGWYAAGRRRQSGGAGGHSITTIRKGGLGVSLRSKTPIVDDEGQVIGIVSVGYLTSYLDSITLTKVINIFIAAILLLIALFIFSWYFTRSIKKQIFSLEPREIGLLVRQQKAMMESIFEGVIVIDHQRRIEVINHAARSLLGLSQPARQLRGQSIDSVISPQPFFASGDMLERDTHDELCRFNQLTVLASRVRIMLENTLQGWVITFPRPQRNQCPHRPAQPGEALCRQPAHHAPRAAQPDDHPLRSAAYGSL